MALTKRVLRPRVTVAAAALALLAVAAVVVLDGRQPRPQIRGHASLQFVALDTAAGKELVRQFDTLGPDPLKLDTGPATFLQLNWSANQGPPSGCQIQLAVHTPPEWRLYGWAGAPTPINATINSWGTVQQHDPDLLAAQHTIILGNAKTGTVMMVWQVPASGQADPSFVHAYTVLACGNADSRASVVQVFP